jgi:ribosome-associated protein
MKRIPWSFNKMEGLMSQILHSDLKEADVSALSDFPADRMAVEAARLLDKHRGVHIRVYDMRGRDSVEDFIVVASGVSLRHLAAMADRLARYFQRRGLEPFGTEGRKGSTWVLVDYGQVVVHLFDPLVREYYDIDAPAKGLKRVDWDTGGDGRSGAGQAMGGRRRRGRREGSAERVSGRTQEGVRPFCATADQAGFFIGREAALALRLR